MSNWAQPIRERLTDFERGAPGAPGETAVSIKLRVMRGCFHREHSPHACLLIDKHLAAIPSRERDFRFEEHESGPEIIVYLAVATAGLTLAKSVVDLVTAIVKALSEGVKRGDRADSQFELIVRRADDANGIKEEKVLRISPGDGVDRAAIEKGLTDAATQLLGTPAPPEAVKPKKSKAVKSKTKKKTKKK